MLKTKYYLYGETLKKIFQIEFFKLDNFKIKDNFSKNSYSIHKFQQWKYYPQSLIN